MVVKCPNCGQLLKSEPESVGICPKCKAKVQFPREKKYQCPHCKHIQESVSDTCEKCGSSMINKHWFARIVGLLGVLYFGFRTICSIHYIIATLSDVEFTYYSFLLDYFLWGQYGIVIPLVALVIFAIMLAYGFLATGKIEIATKEDELDAMFSDGYDYTDSEGIEGFGPGVKLKMVADARNQEIILRSAQGITRVLPFSQVLGVWYGTREQTKRKSVTGGVVVGNVYLHGSPTTTIVDDFVQIRYIPKGTRDERVIRLFVRNKKDAEMIVDALGGAGLHIDTQYTVKKSDYL